MGIATVKRIAKQYAEPVMYSTPFREQDSDSDIVKRVKDRIRYDHKMPEGCHLSGEFTVIKRED